ncbi:protein-glutamate O-methyltransferase [Desulfuromonas versatilis]|uniref:Protein-glutamate O-methyltransferase n=2 Tax=Desulfuromonas versatilis TaxID=2802975 RepID=A0ABM7N7Z4_9BACT|nr:protein-glutamate O-methyltransferase [Desulfuromonas versatilis]
MDALSAQVSRRLGLHFPPERWRDLSRGVEAAAQELQFSSPAACLEHLAAGGPWSRRETEVLARVLTIGETYFFRDPQVFDLIRTQIISPLAASRQGQEKRLRLWSAGCSTGEEAYSLAMLLDQCLGGGNGWDITILATDINPASLKKAREGVYTRWSLRGNHPWLEQGYLQPAEGGRLQVVQKIRDMVRFFPLNLAEDTYPSLLNNTNAMDLILCRNVLMYFHPEQLRRIVENFHRSLVDGGWLIVSACETFKVLGERFNCVSFPEAFFYRKEPHAPSGSSPGEAAPPTAKPCPPRTPRRSVTAADISKKGPPAAEGSLFKTGEPPGSPSPGGERDSLEKAAELLRQGCYEQAAQLAHSLLGEPRKPAAMALLSRIRANQGRLAEAADWCEKLLALDRLQAEFHYLQGTILLEQGQPEQAAAALERALYLDRDFVLAHFTLAHLWEKLGRRTRARKHLENARSLLQAKPATEPLPGADGLTAGRLLETVNLMAKGDAYGT